MTEDTIVIIPARGGSKGLPGKNIKLFMGKPLIYHTIEYALSIIDKSRIFVSTDSKEIKIIVDRYNIEVIDRPKVISGDTATTESAILHVIKSIKLNFKNIILLQVTSPLRPQNSLDEILNHFIEHDFDSLLTISPTHRFFWEIKNIQAIPLYDYLKRPRRQDMNHGDIRYIENGSVYIFKKEQFLKNNNRLGGNIGYYKFPEEFAIEIDSISDFIALEEIAKLNNY